jgi:hypothetical protein
VNYVYTLTDRKEPELFQKMVRSLEKHCDYTLILNCFPSNHQILNFCKDNVKRLIVRNIVTVEWNNRRMCNKIECIRRINFNDGDRIFVLDDDLIVQDDIFKAFETDFDVCVTSRHYDYWYKINAGVWGMKWGSPAREFLDFYISQIKNPTWTPLVEFRQKFGRDGSLDWWVDQDFLCVAYENKVPIQYNLFDIGPKYNFCPSVEENIPGTFESAKKDLLSVVGNKEFKILHLKGRLKTIAGQIND